MRTSEANKLMEQNVLNNLIELQKKGTRVMTDAIYEKSRSKLMIPEDAFFCGFIDGVRQLCVYDLHSDSLTARFSVMLGDNALHKVVSGIKCSGVSGEDVADTIARARKLFIQNMPDGKQDERHVDGLKVPMGNQHPALHWIHDIRVISQYDISSDQFNSRYDRYNAKRGDIDFLILTGSPNNYDVKERVNSFFGISH